MAIELGGTQLEDPLGGSSLLSLLPKTLGGGLSHSQIDASEARELESIKNLFKSMVGKGSTQVMQQAQTTAKSYTNIHTLYSEDGSYAANCQDRPSERRPALGRKRAKFSLKPVPSNSLPNIDFSSSIDHIDDPEEYFSAFEQLEIAEKELKKLRGDVSTDPVQHHHCTSARKRRPGLLGKTASYKHHSSAYADTSENLVESQDEHLDRRILSSSNTSIDTGSFHLFHPEPVEEPGTSQAKNTDSKLQDATESEGTVVEKEKKVSNLLEKLLYSFKDFDGDEGKAFLRESLQMKSIDTGKVRLPDLGNIQLSQHSLSKSRAELKSSQTARYLTKSPLAAMSTLQRRVSLKDPLKDLYSVFPNDDAPCSEGSSLSKSTGKVSLSPVDVGNHDISNLVSDGASSPEVENGTRLGFEDDICAPVGADRSIHNDIIAKEKSRNHPLLERSENPDSNGVVNDRGNISVGCDEMQEANAHALRAQDCIDQGNDIQMDPLIDEQPFAVVEDLILSCSNQPSTQEILDHPSQLLGENTNCDPDAGDKDKDVSGGFDGGLQVEVDNMQQDLSIMNELVTGANQTRTESLASPPSRNIGGNCTSSGTNFENGSSGLDDMSHSEGGGVVHEKVTNAVGTSKGISCPPAATVLTDQHLETIHSLPEENNEENQTAPGPPPNKAGKQKATPQTRNKKKSISGRQILAGSPPNEGRKQKALPRNKKKLTSGRRSLAGAGMIWEDGRRKSSRHRFRPLEHWRGERLLYGRIHESLATVIGVKYVSPGKNTVKVESYVSEEYADLVAQVAR